MTQSVISSKKLTALVNSLVRTGIRVNISSANAINKTITMVKATEYVLQVVIFIIVVLLDRFLEYKKKNIRVWGY